jgi:hypothetical protein
MQFQFVKDQKDFHYNLLQQIRDAGVSLVPTRIHALPTHSTSLFLSLLCSSEVLFNQATSLPPIPGGSSRDWEPVLWLHPKHTQRAGEMSEIDLNKISLTEALKAIP